MPHSYNKIWLHAVFATKYRQHFITPNIEKEVYTFMHSQFTDIKCPVKIINGMPDHVHCLYRMNHAIANADIIKQIKGATTFYINTQKLISQKFAWQIGYGAFAVSESQLDKVYNYIKFQKRHHATKNSKQEFEEFLLLHGYTKNEIQDDG